MRKHKKSTSKIKISSCKIDAKKILSENFFKCIGAVILTAVPKAVLTGIFILSVLALDTKYAVAACFLAFVVFVPTNTFCVAFGELLISRTVDDFYILRSDDGGRKSVFKTLRKIGILKLVKLHFKVLINMLKDTLLSVAPIVVITSFVALFIHSSRVPKESFFVLLSGLILLLIFTLSKIAVERDKYRFIYCDEALFESGAFRGEDGVINYSLKLCAAHADLIVKYENSFMNIAPICTIYLTAYRKLILGVIRSQPCEFESDSGDETREFSAQPDTLVFKIS